MTPTEVLVSEMMDLLAADSTTLAPAALNNKVHLSQAAFTPAPQRVVGDFTEATFTGATALAAGVGTQQRFTDPVTGEEMIQLKEPAGGWHWQTTATTALPQTIYGYYVTDSTSAVLYGCALLDTPVTLTASGQGIDIGQIRLRLRLNPMT